MTPEQELKELGFDIPDSVTPIVAYRSWKIAGGLASHNNSIWTPGKAMKARCVYGNNHHRFIVSKYSRFYENNGGDPNSVPFELCSCGLYSAKREDAQRLVPTRSSYVHGEIYVWGKILETQFGFRSEYAYPKQFFVISEEQKRVVEAMGFGVPVVLVEGGYSLFPFCFPFPVRKGKAKRRRAVRRMDKLYAFPGLAGVPALTVGVIDSLTSDLSQTYMQVLVGMLFGLGLAATSISLYTHRLRRKLRRMNR